MTRVLHVVHAEPGSAAFRRALQSAADGDALLLAGHGVLAVCRPDFGDAAAERQGVAFGACRADLAERGLLGYVGGRVRVLDDDEWLAWLFDYPLLRCWL